MAAADVEEADAGGELLGDREVLTLGRAKHWLVHRAGIMSPGNGQLGQEDVAADRCHPIIASGVDSTKDECGYQQCLGDAYNFTKQSVGHGFSVDSI